jgi:pSer/pThr/pTyr-binding forkhead associated (FHA) protein
MTQPIVLHLLDAAQDHPLQSWTFEDAGTITIGRSDDNDVILADPFVSRSHARLEFDAQGWRVVSISDQQVVSDGQKHRELRLADGATFQLGPRGCVLRVSFGRPMPRNRSTLAFDPATMPIFKLDAARVDQEVSEIASGDYFQKLQAESRRLRERRETNPS